MFSLRWFKKWKKNTANNTPVFIYICFFLSKTVPNQDDKFKTACKELFKMNGNICVTIRKNLSCTIKIEHNKFLFWLPFVLNFLTLEKTTF